MRTNSISLSRLSSLPRRSSLAQRASRSLLAASTLLAALAAGCGSPKHAATRGATPDAKAAVEAGPAPVAPRAAPDWSGAHEVVGSTGTFLVRWRTTPDAIPMNEEFTLRAWVFAADDREHALTDVELVVDAGMPEHKHGMARAPKQTRRPDGSFDAAGMLFHMPGRWELYFDVVRGELTERAQVRVDLE
ncbi:MAG: hypothetical protein IT453_11645 [Planctomycetes bacterium]|nr:hypothetical protein [Planctomycetota bacterium]